MNMTKKKQPHSGWTKGPVPADDAYDDWGRKRERKRKYDKTRSEEKRCGFKLSKRRCFCGECGTKQLIMKPDRGCPQCGSSFTKVEIRYCRRWKGPGMKYCRFHDKRHGLVGPASNLYKHGKDSKYKDYIPERLATVFDRFSGNPNLLANWNEILLLDARIAELLAQVDTGGSLDSWLRVSSLVKSTLSSLDRRDADGALGSLKKLKELADAESVDHSGTWNEIRKLVEQRRRCVETERKTIERENVYVRPDELAFIASELSKTIHKFVPDSHERSKIAYEMERIFFSRKETDKDRRKEVIDVTPQKEEKDGDEAASI